jgi:hypothetical protein
MILTGETEVLGEKHYTASVVGEWMSMEHWWNDTDRGNWSTGRKTLYSVGGRWMNEYGALVEWYWQGEQKYREKIYPVSSLSFHCFSKQVKNHETAGHNFTAHRVPSSQMTCRCVSPFIPTPGQWNRPVVLYKQFRCYDISAPVHEFDAVCQRFGKTCLVLFFYDDDQRLAFNICIKCCRPSGKEQVLRNTDWCSGSSSSLSSLLALYMDST